MKLLVTAPGALLGRAVYTSLAAEHQLIAFDGDLRALEHDASALSGIDAILHLAPLDAEGRSDADWLDHSTRGTYLLAAKAAEAGVTRLILASRLALFPPHLAHQFRVDTSWRPQPTPDTASLCAFLAELCARETCRNTGLRTHCLRFGTLVDDSADPARADALWLHVEDAVQALRCALLDVRASSWSIHHIGYDSDSYVPLDSAQLGWPGFAPPIRYPHPAAVSSPPGLVQIPARAEPIRTVIIFGAGGPLGAAVTRELSSHYTLRLADLKPIDDLLATQQPQSAGAPLAERPQPPHSWLQVDVRDRAQVMAACASMDAIINLSVIRNDLAGDFQVNMLGARHIMEAAVTHGIQRVVHTGPFQLGTRGPLGYDWDYTIVDDVPARPGTDWIYFLSKLCGQELVKIYAHAHGLSVPALTFCEFLNPDVIQMHNIHPLSVSWPDSARAIRAALEVQTLPSPFEYFHIGAPLPHGIYDVSKAERLLGWRARDMLEVFYRR